MVSDLPGIPFQNGQPGKGRRGTRARLGVGAKGRGITRPAQSRRRGRPGKPLRAVKRPVLRGGYRRFPDPSATARQKAGAFGAVRIPRHGVARATGAGRNFVAMARPDFPTGASLDPWPSPSAPARPLRPLLKSLPRGLEKSGSTTHGRSVCIRNVASEGVAVRQGRVGAFCCI